MTGDYRTLTIMRGIRMPILAASLLLIACLLVSSSRVRASPLPEAAADEHKIEDLELEALAAESGVAPSESDVSASASEPRHKRKDTDGGLSVVQNALLNFLKPMPIVDTITEEEKYGNDGDKFNRIGKSIVGGVEKVTDFVNKVTNIPVESVKKLSRSATEVLNNIGGRLVGLQRR